MSFELFQQWLPTLGRDRDMESPQQAAIKNTEFVLATNIGLVLGSELVSWPTRESKSSDAGGDGSSAVHSLMAWALTAKEDR